MINDEYNYWKEAILNAINYYKGIVLPQKEFVKK